ncbi:MAG: PP2C family protein-serine/threonine phosphatase [Acidimicrobiales bacterium]
MSTTRFTWAVRTEVGRVREINQDSVYAEDGLFAVADGMGGHSGGEVASAVAIGSLAEAPIPESIDAFVDRVRDAHAAIVERADQEPDLYGMGTTLCAVVRLDNDRLGLVNVGDSRIYRFTSDGLEQVSEDHSLVGDLVRAGHLSETEASSHPQRNIVTRALGIGDDLLVDYWELPALVGDRYLLCSDGLVDELSDSQISAAMRRLDEPGELVDELVRLANESGSRDNVSVLVVRIDSADGDPGADMNLAPTRSAPPTDESEFKGVGTGPLVDGRNDDADHDDDVENPGEQVRFHRRALGSALVVLFILIGGFWLIATYARNNYFVGFEQEQVVIFQGRPGGVLWFDPTVEEGAILVRTGLTPALELEVTANPEFGSLGSAQEYISELEDRAAAATGDG